MVLRGIPRSGGGDEGDDIRRGRSAPRGRVILTLCTSPIGNLAGPWGCFVAEKVTYVAEVCVDIWRKFYT
jgi:hypothetical protein